MLDAGVPGARVGLGLCPRFGLTPAETETVAWLVRYHLLMSATALRFGGTMVAGGLACMIHGIVPALFTTTGSGTVRRLHARMQGRAHVAAEAYAGEVRARTFPGAEQVYQPKE